MWPHALIHNPKLQKRLCGIRLRHSAWQMKWARLFLSLYRYEEMFLEAAQHKAVPVRTLVPVREPEPNAMNDGGHNTKGYTPKVSQARLERS